MRILIPHDPSLDTSRHPFEQSPWPAKWVGHPDHFGQESVVIAYRRPFALAERSTVRIHTTADQRYELFLDGQRIGRGSERGDLRNWFYESHDLDLAAGEHMLVARTWWLTAEAPSPYAQMSVRPGFFLMAEGPLGETVTTGVAPWECKVLGGYSFEAPAPPRSFCVVGARTRIRGADFPWGFERGLGDGWQPVRILAKAAVAAAVGENPREWMLRPALLPPMFEQTIHAGRARHVELVASAQTAELPVTSTNHRAAETVEWNELLAGHAKLTIPPHTRRRVIVDLDNYFCAYPELTVSGGKDALVRIHWAEGLFEPVQADGVMRKGNRDVIEGKCFFGMGETFEPDGGANRRFEPLWWEAGRYVEFYVATAEQPLVIDSFRLHELHYPHEFVADFESSDPRLQEIIPIALRTLEMCSQETYFDCPYYEQLMYVGDTRMEVLVTYATTRDDRLPRKAIEMFDLSRVQSGLTHSRYPSRIQQVIPPFSLWWVGMLHDFMMWRGDRAFLQGRAPAMRAILDAWRAGITRDHLVENPIGWNYLDWVPGWNAGMPAENQRGPTGTFNWQFVAMLKLAAEIEDFLGEPELAARNRRTSGEIATAAAQAFWHEERGLFSEDLAKKHFSEHAQCLALISRTLDSRTQQRVEQSLFTDGDLYRTTIYFSHYLFEACRLSGRMESFFDRLSLWFDLKRMGFKTTVESPEPSRSDCHAWGAHPVFHYFASVLGIRPAAPGFSRVRIEPQLGPLSHARGAMPHPRGTISADVRIQDGKMRAQIELPDGLEGVLIIRGAEHPLRGGRQTVES